MINRDDFKRKFITISQNGLPGDEAHIELAPVNRSLTGSFDFNQIKYNESAVGVVLYATDNTTNCVLIKRPDYPGVHGNQISFPGGKMDRDDLDLEHTARREVYEEINLKLYPDHRIGELSQLYIPVSKFMVNPFVYYLDEIPQLNADEREVDSIIHFDVFQLLDNEIIKTTDIRLSNGLIRKNVPFFDLEGQVVWGATAMMLAELRSILKQF